MNKLNEEELCLDFVKNPNNTNYRDNLHYINQRNSKLLSQFLGITQTTMLCEKCSDQSNIFEPFSILSLSLRGRPTNVDHSQTVQITHIESSNLKEMVSVKIPKDGSYEKIFDVLTGMQKFSDGLKSDMYFIRENKIELIESTKDFAFAVKKLSNWPEGKLFVVAAEALPEELDLEFHAKLHWKESKDNKPGIGSNTFCFPIKSTKDKLIFQLESVKTQIETYLRELLQDNESNLPGKVKIGVFCKDNFLLEKCSICGKISCFSCFEREEKGFENLIDQIFSFSNSQQATRLDLIDVDAGNREPTPGIRFVFLLEQSVEDLCKAKEVEMPPVSIGSKKTESIEDLLKLYTGIEYLKEEDWITCSKCNHKTCSQKSNKIVYLPKILVLHIKRFRYMSSGNFTKNHQMIRYGPRLDMTSFYTQYSENNENIDIQYSQKKMNRVKVPLGFKLKAVVNHVGSIHGGHYFAYIEENGIWSNFNDDEVSELVSGDPVTANAYLLFYERE